MCLMIQPKKKVHEVVVKLCAERPIRSKVRLAYECQLRINASLTPIMGTKKEKKIKRKKEEFSIFFEIK